MDISVIFKHDFITCFCLHRNKFNLCHFQRKYFFLLAIDNNHRYLLPDLYPYAIDQIPLRVRYLFQLRVNLSPETTRNVTILLIPLLRFASVLKVLEDTCHLVFECLRYATHRATLPVFRNENIWFIYNYIKTNLSISLIIEHFCCQQ